MSFTAFWPNQQRFRRKFDRENALFRNLLLRRCDSQSLQTVPPSAEIPETGKSLCEVLFEFDRILFERLHHQNPNVGSVRNSEGQTRNSALGKVKTVGSRNLHEGPADLQSCQREIRNQSVCTPKRTF